MAGSVDLAMGEFNPAQLGGGRVIPQVDAVSQMSVLVGSSQIRQANVVFWGVDGQGAMHKAAVAVVDSGASISLVLLALCTKDGPLHSSLVGVHWFAPGEGPSVSGVSEGSPLAVKALAFFCVHIQVWSRGAKKPHWVRWTVPAYVVESAGPFEVLLGVAAMQHAGMLVDGRVSDPGSRALISASIPIPAQFPPVIRQIFEGMGTPEAAQWLALPQQLMEDAFLGSAPAGQASDGGN